MQKLIIYWVTFFAALNCWATAFAPKITLNQDWKLVDSNDERQTYESKRNSDVKVFIAWIDAPEPRKLNKANFKEVVQNMNDVRETANRLMGFQDWRVMKVDYSEAGALKTLILDGGYFFEGDSFSFNERQLHLRNYFVQVRVEGPSKKMPPPEKIGEVFSSVQVQ